MGYDMANGETQTLEKKRSAFILIYSPFSGADLGLLL